MAKWDILKQSIAFAIKANDNQEITASILNDTLINIVKSVGENASFVGVATKATSPGNHDGSVFYIASESGIYPNFGRVEVTNELACIIWDGTSWRLENTGIPNSEGLGKIIKEIQTQIDELIIDTDKIANGSVTLNKLADEVHDAIAAGGGGGGGTGGGGGGGSTYIPASYIKTYMIAEDQVAESKLSPEVREKLNSGMSEIADGSISTNKIADGAITKEKLSESVADSLDVMNNKLDILYKVALTFSGGGNKKKGTSVNVTLSWTVKVNGTAVNPSSQTLNGEALDVTMRTKTFTGVTTDTTYTLVVDGVQATQSVKFYNPSYFGVVAPDYQVSSDVSGLTEQTNYGSRSLTKTASASGSMKVVYLYPSALGSLTSIKDGNNLDITDSFTKTTDITINGEEYIAYLLTQEANINGLTFKFA